MKTIGFSLIFLIELLMSSCSLLPESKMADSSDVKSWVYATAKEYDLNIQIKSNPYASAMMESFQGLLDMTGTKYKCKTPIEERIKNTQKVECLLNEDVQGDSFTGYLVIYRVNIEKTHYYLLVSLVEFDDDDRYEAKVEAIESNLSEIKAYLE